MKNTITLLYKPQIDANKIINRLSEKIKPTRRSLDFKNKIESKKMNIAWLVGFLFILLHIIAGLIYFLIIKDALAIL